MQTLITAATIVSGVAIAGMTLVMLWFVWDSRHDEAHAPGNGDDDAA
ncbi:hypothetical protein [Halopenitus persicus]|uniref:Uncharacterized protein n=1 Tax=Halopenitus persicus TaxID=1048396 RepID=A0A1H3LVB8_9EURY|nr:hypothetical protein [Halopenitus persicus]QHS18113.1 hypothetical protein GWK26_13645 [haloarchaeon 3A1-DGR]SDY68331.1 hypothetical protein SAMN05216564_10820 [Halopenitus persicus]